MYRQITQHFLYLLFLKVFWIYNVFNLVNVCEDFIFSGKAFNIITPVYENDLRCVLGTSIFLLGE